MSNERPEFPPIESAPPRHTWVWALAGAALVVGLIWIARRAPDPSPARPPAALAAIADAKPATPAEAAKPPPAAAKAPESPNVLGSAVAAAKSVAMVARAELDRELARTKSAQAQAAAYRKQIDDLQKQLGAARSQIAAMQTAQKPPPPSDQEQILQTLAPVLRAGNGGSP
jgi:predicted lipid-binding transport protein (Tim44 family)